MITNTVWRRLGLVLGLGLLLLTAVLTPMSPVLAADKDSMAMMQAIVEKVPIINGGFDVKISANIPPLPTARPLQIGKALVNLSPDGQQGLINSIKISRIITGADGNPKEETEFGCVNLKVAQNTDLIKSCGGPALLGPGLTTYQASGKNFGPEAFGDFSIILIPD